MRKMVYAVLFLVMASVSVGYAQPTFEHRSLEEALNPDGTLKRGVQGSFSVKGYTMRTGANGEPIFVPQTQNAVNGTWDTQFGLPVPGVSGTVFALAADAQGNIYVGGQFTVVSGISTPVNNIARYNIATNSWSALGTGAQNGVNNWVNALAIDGLGRVYVGGKFTQAGGVNANYVARFDTTTNTWSALGTGAQNGVNNWVNALAIDGLGRVYVGGRFTQAGAVNANYVARYNPQDSTWSALGTGTQNGVSGFYVSVNALAIDGLGRVYVGGEFTQAGAVNANYVARYNPQDSTWSALGTGAQNGVSDNFYTFVNALAIDGLGRVYVGGKFIQAGGTVNAKYVARYNPQDSTWSALGTGAQNGVNGQVNALAIDGSGKVYVGGFFTQAGGVNANYVARFDTTTNTWSTLGTAQDGVGGVSNPFVRALAIDGSGKVYVGGLFSQAGGVNANNVARFDTTANTWSALGTGAQNGVNGQVNALAIDGSGKVYVGGSFTQAGGVSANYVARFDPAMSSWSTLGTGAQNGVNGQVNALAIDGSGKVYVGGLFSQAGGVNANFVARFDPATNSWSALGTGAQNGVNGGVSALAIDGSGKVYVGGGFTQAGGVNANYVARFDTTTNTWSALGTGVSGTVNALAVFGNEVYVGGFFTVAGGVNANYVARFDTTTNTWSALGTGVNGYVNALAVFGNKVYVGGFFTVAGGVNANNVARYNPQDSTWSALGTGVSGTVNALAVFGNEVYVGGFFTVAGGVNANNVARFDPQANSWSALGTGVNGTVNALAVFGNEVYAGGNFTEAGGFVSEYIARYFPPVANPSASQTVSANAIYYFSPTGVSISFTGVSGTGTCVVQRFDAPAQNVTFSGTPPINTSQYRFVITASGFTFSQAELRFNRLQIPNSGIGNPQTVNVYRRATPGSGAFSLLPNAYSPSAPDEVRATTTAFSEFILGSDDNSNQLPVELTAFGFRKVDSGIELYWRTATEQNNAGFEVERKSQGGNWNTLGFVRGRGTTTEAQSYSFLDRTASGKVQYRLKQVDFDGRFEYSNIIEVDAGAPKVFALEQNYPNPFNPTTVISYQLPVASDVSLKVYDVLGREVMTLVNGRQEAGAYNITLNGANLASGIYFYRLQAGNFVSTRKMMLVK